MRCEPHNAAQKLNGPFFFSGVDKSEPHRLCPAKKPLGTLLCNALTVTGLPPFLALPSPHAANELLCEGACFPSPRLHVALTSGHRVDAVEPICLATKAQPPNPMKAEAVLNHGSSQSSRHHAENRLYISLQFILSFIAIIARMRPELNRDKFILRHVMFQAAPVARHHNPVLNPSPIDCALPANHTDSPSQPLHANLSQS